MLNPTPKVSARYGAPMGRYSARHLDTEKPLYLRLCPLDAGGYDRGGVYWGHSPFGYLYAVGDGSGWVYFRARDRADAKEEAIALVCEAEGCEPQHVRFKR